MKKCLCLLLSLTMLCLCAGAALAETVALKVWGSQEDQELLAELCEAFAAEHPETTYEFTYGVVGEADAKARYLEDPAAAADVFSYPDDQIIDLVNADALYEGALTSGALPFDWEAFSANPARVRIQAFERDSGRTVRFGREEMTDPTRMVNIVRASSTLPGAMQPLPIDGVVYYDGGLGTGAGIPLCMAEDDGFERFFFVATRPRGYRKQPPTEREARIYARIAKDYPYLRKALLSRWERYNVAIEHVERLAAEGRAYVVYPDEMTVGAGP